MDQKRPQRAKLFSLKYLVYDFVKVTAALPGLLWLRPRWRYENKEARRRIRGGAVVIANHVGFFDPIYVMFAIWYRRHHFICGKEFFESKSRWWFEHFLCIPVDRGNFKDIAEHRFAYTALWGIDYTLKPYVIRGIVNYRKI